MFVPGVAVALHLFAHIPKGIERPAFVKLVDGDHIGKVEHVNLLQLGGCAKFRRHHVERYVGVIYDFCVTLPYARGFQNNQIELCSLEDIHGRVHIFRKRQIALAGCQRAHVHPWRIDGVHANAVAQQRTTSFSFGRIYRHDGDGFTFKIEQKAPHKLIHHRRFS